VMISSPSPSSPRSVLLWRRFRRVSRDARRRTPESRRKAQTAQRRGTAS
jgi:hypothetical protein